MKRMIKFIKCWFGGHKLKKISEFTGGDQYECLCGKMRRTSFYMCPSYKPSDDWCFGGSHPVKRLIMSIFPIHR